MKIINQINRIACVGLLAAMSTTAHCGPTISPSIQSFGEQEIRNQTIDKISHSGHLEISHTTVQDSAILNGTVNAKNTTFQNLTVNGDIVLDESQVINTFAVNGSLDTDDSSFKGTVLIHGMISAESSQFNEKLTLHGNHAEFEECELQNLEIKTADSSTPPQVFLEETTIKGDVIFDKEGGVVLVDEKSKILGQVKGGTIKKS